jgi:predicted enzyme related to lactoylglutathione lyase
MNITQVQTVTIPVSDQEKAKDFYVGALGFEVGMDSQMGPVRWLQVAPRGGATGFVLATEGQVGMKPGSVGGLILQTADLDSDADSLRGAGVAVDGPNDVPWGRQATFADPDGNSFVLAAAPSGF